VGFFREIDGFWLLIPLLDRQTRSDPVFCVLLKPTFNVFIGQLPVRLASFALVIKLTFLLEIIASPDPHGDIQDGCAPP
jgi:hypothetical protein